MSYELNLCCHRRLTLIVTEWNTHKASKATRRLRPKKLGHEYSGFADGTSLESEIQDAKPHPRATALVS